MSSSLTMILHNYARPENMRQVIASLRRQTIQPKIILWDNAPVPLENPDVDWLIRSSVNDHGYAFCYLAQRANTDFVGRMDDDLMPADDRVFEDALNTLQAGSNILRI